MKICVVGMGYVGLSNAILLAQHNEVLAYDIAEERVAMLNRRVSPIAENLVGEYLSDCSLNLVATANKSQAYLDADFVFVATPTDYDQKTNSFNTSSVEAVVRDVVNVSPRAVVVIKSTVPLGFTENLCKQFPDVKLIFSPEFLREDRALYDNLHPSRIVIGSKSPEAKILANLMQQGAVKDEITVLFTNSSEAEAIKLFSNTYLAMRVAYFNELDTFCITQGLDSKHLIDGVCQDPRIGDFYNNPSFGYGGYCLPKDTRQLLANYRHIPQNLIHAIVESNVTRMSYIADEIWKSCQKLGSGNLTTIGIYRIVMKRDSDNFRESSTVGVLDRLLQKGARVIVFEPNLKHTSNSQFKLVNDFQMFKKKADVILANRVSPELTDVYEKVYTRDIFQRD